MVNNSQRDAVALQELVKATEARCKELEQQIHVRLSALAQQKSGEEVRQGLQRACVQQVQAVRSRAAKQAVAHRCYRESLPAALSHTLHEVVLSSLAAWSAALQPDQTQRGLQESLEELLRAAIAQVDSAFSDSTHDPAPTELRKLQDIPCKIRNELTAELSDIVGRCVQYAVREYQISGSSVLDAGNSGPHQSLGFQDQHNKQHCTVQDEGLQEAHTEAQELRNELESCKGKLNKQQLSHDRAIGTLQSTVEQLQQRLQHERTQAAGTDSSAEVRRLQAAQQNAMKMVATMENSLGNLSASVRSKDAEIGALQRAMQEQFSERNNLRAQVSGLDGQLVRLQGSYAELEARLQSSEEDRLRLQAAQLQFLRTEDRVGQRFRNHRLTASVTSCMHGMHGSSSTGSAAVRSAGGSTSTREMHADTAGGGAAATKPVKPPRKSSHRELPGLPKVSSRCKVSTERFQTVPKPCISAAPAPERKSFAASAAMLQKEAHGRSSWLQGTGGRRASVRKAQEAGRLQTDLIQFQWESGAGGRAADALKHAIQA